MPLITSSLKRMLPVLAAGVIGLGLGLAVHLRAQSTLPPPPLGGPASERPPGPPGPHAPSPPPPHAALNVPPVNLQKADAAIKLAQEAALTLAPGQVWVRTGPAGDQHVDATVLYQNRAIARLRFNPLDGTMLPTGYEPSAPTPPPAPGTAIAAPVPVNDAVLVKIRESLPEMVRALQVIPAVAVESREGFWRLPVIYQNKIVSDMKVSGEATQVVEDFAAARDAAIFAR